MLEDLEIKKILTATESLTTKCELLIGRANKMGGKDNITVLLALVASKDEVDKK